MPYYLVQEGLFDEGEINLKPKLEPCTTGFLEPSDIKGLLVNPEASYISDTLEKRLNEGSRCFGIKYKGELTAYMWCDFFKCNIGSFSLPLKDDEASLFDARTFKAYRGKNLAPYLRYQLYKHLAQMGRTRLYSITSIFNAPALNFKKKLRARPLRLYLCIDFLGKYQWTFHIKDYNR